MRVRAPLLAAVAALLTCAAPASADTFNVTAGADGQGSCSPNGSTWTCSTLRAAMTEANRLGGPNTISLPARTYQVSSTALPIIANNAAFIGGGARNTRVQGDGKSFRVFSVGAGQTVSMTGLTVADGAALSDNDPAGGNILVTTGASLSLDHMHITGGTAQLGGGIGSSGGHVTVAHSLVDHNTARANANGANGVGGGITSVGARAAVAVLDVSDSTIAFNTALRAGGIAEGGNTSDSTSLERVTLARNTATGANPGGLLSVLGATTVHASIVADNTGVVPNAAAVVPAPSNCQVAALTDGGANVEYPVTDCGFSLASDRRADPLLSSELQSAGGQTDVLTIPGTSPAVDLSPTCPGSAPIVDQRDLARPIGAGCDAGAYEGDFVPPPATIDSGPSGTTSDTSASFTFSSSEAGTSFECRLDGPAGQGTFAPCASPTSFSGLAPGPYTFFVRATDAAGNTSTTSRSFTVAVVAQQTPTPTPTPAVNKTVVIQPVSGKVLVKLPGKKTFEPVDVTRGIPNGATVDTRKGKIRLFAIPKAGKPAENALFYGGIFQVKLGGGVTELRLTEQLAKCPRGTAAAAAAKKKPKTRKLWGDGSGSFRTRGQYSSATVRGTRWLVQDSCGKTLTRVAKGVVQVQDFVKHKKLLLRAPKRYTARKKH
jgi:hypothetical protein